MRPQGRVGHDPALRDRQLDQGPTVVDIPIGNRHPKVEIGRAPAPRSHQDEGVSLRPAIEPTHELGNGFPLPGRCTRAH